VYITDPVSRSRQIRTVGRVVRAESQAAGGFAIEFTGLSGSTAERVRRAVAAWSSGPAAFHGREALLTPGSASAGEAGGSACAPPPGAPGDAAGGPTAAADASAPCAGTEAGGEAPWIEPSGAAPGEPTPADASGEEPIAPEPFDRRRAPRRDYHDRRVVALGEQAARVLIGYDVSIGGMRVAPHPTLRPGQRFRVALHGSAGESPLVVQAAVARDDGERGLVLAFQDLAETCCRRLEKMLAGLPIVETCREEAEGVLVSEILGPDSA